jgi:3-deoxy-D-arabino-heptulosonate 7-phosphate (DAHP) synthase
MTGWKGPIASPRLDSSFNVKIKSGSRSERSIVSSVFHSGTINYRCTEAGNTNRRGRLNTVDPLIVISCFGIKF